MNRTSEEQFNILVEYMERNGDLSKPTDGPQGRIRNLQHWSDLSDMLNAEGTGATRTPAKWRKVWSDFKNNTKRKAARIYHATSGTGGGPASTVRLNDLEQRVLTIIGTRAATGIVQVPEIGLNEEDSSASGSQSLVLNNSDNSTHNTTEEWQLEQGLEDQVPQLSILVDSMLALPGTDTTRVTSQSPVPGHSSSASASTARRRAVPVATSTPLSSRALSGNRSPPMPLPPQAARQPQRPLPSTQRQRRRRHRGASPLQRRTRTQTQSELARQAYVNSDTAWRALHQETERERIRLRERELDQQDRWLQLLNQFITLGTRIADILERNRTNMSSTN